MVVKDFPTAFFHVRSSLSLCSDEEKVFSKTWVRGCGGDANVAVLRTGVDDYVPLRPPIGYPVGYRTSCMMLKSC